MEPESPNSIATPESYRDRCARRLFIVACLTFVCPLLIPYTIYLLAAACFGPGPLASRGSMDLFVGGILAMIAIPFGLNVMGCCYIIAFNGR